MDKELAAKSYPESDSQWLSVQMEVSDKQLRDQYSLMSSSMTPTVGSNASTGICR